MADNASNCNKRSRRDDLAGKAAITSANNDEPEENQATSALSAVDEAVHLQNIFPEELWLMIFENFGDQTIFENLVKASPYWRQILEPRRIEYLFPSVLPILIQWRSRNERNEDDYILGHEDHSDDEHIDEDEDDEEEARNTRKAAKRMILPLRQVCRFWEKGVQIYTLEHPSHLQINHQVCLNDLSFRENQDDSDYEDYSGCGSHLNKPRPEWYDLKYLQRFKIQKVEQLEKFMDKFDRETGRNPLFHRKLIIDDWQYPVINLRTTMALYDSITAFLRQFGTYLWFCEIRAAHFISRPEYYLIIREWLSLMPNLRVLWWKFPVKWSVLEERDTHSRSRIDDGLNEPPLIISEIENVVRENPLARMEHLQVFKVDDLPYPIFTEFIRKNEHVQKLQFHRKFPPPSHYKESYNMENGLAPNVREMSIILWGAYEINDLESGGDWPFLEKLSVFWGDSDNILYWGGFLEGYRRKKQIFKVLRERCGKNGTLKDLTLHLTQPSTPTWALKDNPRRLEVLKASATLQLNLPSVRKLKLIMPLENANVGFLLPAMKECLEELEVGLQHAGEFWRTPLVLHGSDSSSTDSPHIIEEHPGIRVEGYHNKMYESNIWKELPKLQNLHLKIVNEGYCHLEYKYKRRNAPQNVEQGAIDS